MEELKARLRKFRDEREWNQFHCPKNLAISVSIEAAELLELFQWAAENEPMDEEKRAAVAEEVADVFLYLVLLCEKADIDLLSAANAKIDVNEQRFPIGTTRGIAKPPKE